MNKKSNLWRIVWVTSIYAVLITILYLVVLYKVRWEDKDLSRYLYMYKCGDDAVCTTDNKVDGYYSRVKCPQNVCPRILDIRDHLIILGNDEENHIFDYKNDAIINESYQKYEFTSSQDHFIATDIGGNMGIINREGEEVTKFKYEKILDYNYDLVIYQDGEKQALEDVKNDKIIGTDYDQVLLFNSEKYIYRKEDTYYIAYLSNQRLVSDTKYDYVYPFKHVLLVVHNGQLDIIDNNMKSKLVMKINTYYQYNNDIERKTLNIKQVENLLKFNIYDGDQNVEYTFDTKSNKLL